jgi:hypothetical protein
MTMQLRRGRALRRRYGRASGDTVTRQVGECQICEHTQKLQGGRLVLHGYKRPGEGHVYGDCPGTGAEPYEVSCDAIKSYQRSLIERTLPSLEARIADIDSGKVTKVTRVGTWGGAKDYAVGDPGFERALQDNRHDVENQISNVKHEIKRAERRIAAWAPKPIRTVEEMVQKDLTAKAERKAAREAARVARAEKKAVYAAKQQAIEVKHQEIRQALVAQLNALAAEPPSPERDAAARKLWGQVMHSKKYAWLWVHEILSGSTDASAAAISLGLAHRGPDGRTRPWAEGSTDTGRYHA